MNLPDFLVIGAQRSGTTSLFYYLTRHPRILSPTVKETHYFDVAYKRGHEWYMKHFPETKQHQIVGEATPRYILDKEAPRRAYETVPEAKIIALLRNPVNRAYSHYWHEVRMGTEDKSFEEALSLETERGDAVTYGYVERGNYYPQLRRWMRYYPDMLVIRSEDFYTDTDRVYNRVLGYLGVPNFHLPEYPQLLKGDYPPMKHGVRKTLYRRFRDYNMMLYEYLGWSKQWEDLK